MFIEEMQILVDCKRLVECMLTEKRHLMKRLHDSGKEDSCKYMQKEIDRLEAALQGKGVRPYEHS